MRPSAPSACSTSKRARSSKHSRSGRPGGSGRRRIVKFIGLVLKSAKRSKRRTLLTVMSVAIAVFLFAALRAVLDGFNAGADAASSTPPTSPFEPIKNTPGVRDVTWASWFGGIYKDPKTFFGQIAIEPESYLR